MAKYAIAGVGYGKAFDSSGNLLFKSTTLTDDGFNTSTSMEEIRGGAGNSLQAIYNHTSKFEATLKDCLADLVYVALQTGSSITSGANIYATETVTTSVNNSITVLGTPATFGTLGTIGWYTIQGQTAVNKITFTSKTATDISGLPSGSVVCVTYMTTDASARVVEILSAFVPSEVHLVFTLPLFKAGIDATTISTSSQLGEWIVDVPRFKFEGALALATTSSSSVGVDIKGMALASTSVNGCGDKSIYATITEVIYNKDEFANVSALAIADADVSLQVNATATLKVYKIYNDGTSATVVDNSKLTFVSATPATATVGANTGLVTGKVIGTTTYTATVTSKTSLSTSGTIAVTA